VVQAIAVVDQVSQRWLSISPHDAAARQNPNSRKRPRHGIPGEPEREGER
jgi:hypothetical protein